MQLKNNSMRNKVTAVLTFLVIAFSLYSQSFEIKGNVSDDVGPMVGVSVSIKGKNKGTVSDIYGKFALMAEKNDIISASFIGYETKEIKINSAKELNIIMQQTSQALEELVVIGYGTMKKRDITGSISSISSEQIAINAPVDISSALQGKISGLEIISNTGQPGDQSVMRIRGTGTLSSEGASPLFVVDGVEVEHINDINPRDIASIEVLKDAASAAIYGSKSGNGVILVTTKQGEKGKTKINIDYTLKRGELSHKLPQMNRSEGIAFDKISNYFSGGGFYVAGVDSLSPGYMFDNDYQELLFRSTYSHQLDASASGASDKFRYYLTGGFLDQPGIMLNTYYKRLSGRLNVQYQPTNRVKIGGTYSYSQSDTKTAPWSAKSYLSRPSVYGLKYPDGSYVPTLSSRPNPLAVLDLGKFNTKYYYLTMYNFLEYEILKNFVFKTVLSGTMGISLYNEFSPAILSQDRLRKGAQTNSISSSWINENTLSYNFSINKHHHLSALLGLSLSDKSYNTNSLYVTGNITDATPYPVGYTDVDMNKTNVSISGYKIASYFGRLSYNYKGKYLFNSNFRADGSTRFGRDNRWGYFPSSSIGWRFSDETFMSFLKPYLSDGKLRLSYGVTGNQSTGNFASIALYSSSYYANYIGIYPSQLENKNLKWETSEQLNTGLDLSFFNNRLNIVFDYYNKRTSDVLFNVKLPQTAGFYSSYQNIGDIHNKGMELSITSHNIEKRDFRWSTTLSLSKNQNMITDIPDGGRYINYWVFLVDKGYPVGTMWGYKKNGIFSYNESNAFTPDGVQLTPLFNEREQFLGYELNGTAYTGEIKQLRYNSSTGELFKGGDVIWDDINNDGIIDVNDEQVIGNGQPDLTGGLTNEFTYKNFELSFFFYFSVGNDIYNKQKANVNNFGVSSLTRPDPLVLAQSWTAPGDIALYPRPQGGISGVRNTRDESSMWVEDGSYIRLKSLKLGYKFPESMLKKIKISSANFYVLLQNYFTWTNYSGFDPEIGSGGIFAVGYDGTTYPRSKEIVCGIQVNF